MKQCPFCKSNIQDDARFCIYCMTSLDNKTVISDTKRRNVRPIAMLSLIAAVCVIMAVFAVLQISKSEQIPFVTPAATPSSPTGISSTTTPTAAFTTPAASTTQTVITTTVPKEENRVSYLYRPVESGDEFIAIGVARPENGITIIGVETPAEDGIYDIPEYIDGNPVLAVAEYAFCAPAIAPTVKTVYFPKTMTTVKELAFSSCYNLSDVYYRGNIFIWGYAYPSKDHRAGPLTIHCSADCHNRNFRLYKNMIDETVNEEENIYYEEWNGD